MFFGLIVLVLGFIFLLRNLGVIGGEVWPVIWPCLLIVLGLTVLWKRKKHAERWDKFSDDVHKFGEKIGKTFGEENK